MSKIPEILNIFLFLSLFDSFQKTAFVIPAKAGIYYKNWIPAFAGMTEHYEIKEKNS